MASALSHKLTLTQSPSGDIACPVLAIGMSCSILLCLLPLPRFAEAIIGGCMIFTAGLGRAFDWGS